MRAWPATRPWPVLGLILLMLLAGCAQGPDPAGPLPQTPPPYDYAIDNGWAATVLGTPHAQQLPDNPALQPRRRDLLVFPDRQIPEGFWYQDRLHYSELMQPGPAALAFVIAGTGADDQSRHMLMLAQALYRAGLHVVLLPSPTHPNFIITASETRLPGRADADAADLYRVMDRIEQRLRKRHRITGHMLTGYSLGAWHAAFVARLDEREKRFGFEWVLLINPPLSLYHSIQQIDAMLLRGLPGGIDGLNRFLDQAVARLTSTAGTDALDFNDPDVTFEAFNRLQPSDDRLATIIGLSFRLSAANLIFSADVMRRAGYIFPKDQTFTSETRLSDVFSVAIRTSLLDYFQDIYAGHYLQQYPGLSQADLLAQTSLTSIGPWLAQNRRVWLMTNADDVILAPGDLDGLRRIFAGRAHIFPNGGHMGNLAHRAVMDTITRFFAAPTPSLP
ncbi:alpha/beta fold hydrolase [Oleisolibacter albus]|uniref:alpha/beta fold hydrolase n=1 Tax=Oleisolibacter albus TaxID=2171757 RepID=UPI0012D7A211|nr:alpha/beta fold hydrolase [Oleisolibacter albus]